MTETVLVTGGTGFVGGWCIAELLERGYAVRTTLRSAGREAQMRKAVASIVEADDRLTVFVADLTRDEGWDEAVSGCKYVLHVASPLGVDMPRDPNVLIVPAREGALRVLGAAARAGVERVVMTSSVAASAAPQNSADSVSDETVWTDPDEPRLTAYRKSKIIAERAAWDFVATPAGRTSLTTILPSAVLGPMLTSDVLGSVQVVSRLLTGRIPGTPRLGFSIVDVRDLADAHIRAMTAPEADGQRLIAAGDFLWMSEIAGVLRAALGPRARKVPTRGLPDFVLRLMALFDPTLRTVTPGLGHRHAFSREKAGRLLGWTPRPAAETIVDCAESLIARGVA